MDIPDIDISVQFLVAGLLSVWMQCAGRAGHAGQHALAILLVEPGIFEVKPLPKSKPARKEVNKEGADDGGAGTQKDAKESNAGKRGSGKKAPGKGVLRGQKRTAEGEVLRPSAPSQGACDPEHTSTTATAQEPSDFPYTSADSQQPSAPLPQADPLEGVVIEYKKKAEDGMRKWAGAKTCRRVIADTYFNNPPKNGEYDTVLRYSAALTDCLRQSF